MLSVSVRPIIWFCTYVFLKNASSMILVNGTRGGGHIRAAGCTMSGSPYDVINNLTLYIEKQLLAEEEEETTEEEA